MIRSLEKTQIILKDGKPKAVILDINKYERLLEMAEEKEDAAELRLLKKEKFLSFKTFTPTLAQKRDLKNARQDYKKGKYLTIHELKRKLATQGKR